MRLWNRLFPLVMATAIINPVFAADSVSADYASLLSKIIEQQPQQMKNADWQSLSKNYRDQSDRWISGDVNLILHHENDALMSNDGVRNYEIGAEAMLQLPGQQQSMQQVAEAYNQLPAVQKTYLNWLASGKLRNLSWQLQQSQTLLSLAEQAVQQSQSLLDKVELKKKAGDATQLDWVMAQSEVLKRQAELSQKRNQYDFALQQFTAWTGATQLPSSITETLLANLGPEHPQLLLLGAKQSLAESELAMAKSQSTASPSLFIGAKQDQQAGPDHSTLIAEVSLPLGYDQQRQINIAQQRSNLTDQSVQLAQAKRQLQQDRVKNEQRLVDLREQKKLWHNNLQLNQQKQDMMQKAYQLGAVSIESLLRAQQDYLAAKQQYEQTSIEEGATIAQLNQIYGHSLAAK